MSYSTKIVREQEGSKLNINTGGSVQYHDGAVLQFGGIRFYFGATLPTITANAGDIYFRGGSGTQGGSAAGIYMNVSDGAAGGSVWRRAASATGD